MFSYIALDAFCHVYGDGCDHQSSTRTWPILKKYLPTKQRAALRLINQRHSIAIFS